LNRKSGKVGKKGFLNRKSAKDTKSEEFFVSFVLFLFNFSFPSFLFKIRLPDLPVLPVQKISPNSP